MAVAGLVLAVAVGVCVLAILGPPPTMSIHEAAIRGDVRQVKRCAAWGAALDARDKYGETPLGWAIYYHHGNATTAATLMDLGCNVNGTNREGETALHVAATYNDDVLIELLLDSGACIESRDIRGRTPLLDAVAAGQPEATRMLLERGANVGCRDATGLTARELATKYGMSRAAEVIEMVRRHGEKD
jgi:ankyrin repeat protein